MSSNCHEDMLANPPLLPLYLIHFLVYIHAVRFVTIRSSLIAQKAAWDSCRNAADDLKVNNAWQDKTNGFAEWQSKTTLWQISMMATYTPNNHAPDVAVHIVDEWKKAKPLKKQRIHDVDAEGFTKIQRKTKELKRSGSDDDDEEDEEEDEEDEEEEEEMYSEWNPDALRERASRYTEEHDFFEYRALESNEEIVKRLVKRPIEFYPTTKLRERLAVRNLHDLPTVDRKKLIKSWGELLQQDAQVDLYTHMKDYKRAADQITEHDAVVDTAHLKSASAIGMTTSGAAKYSRCGSMYSSVF